MQPNKVNMNEMDCGRWNEWNGLWTERRWNMNNEVWTEGSRWNMDSEVDNVTSPSLRLTTLQVGQK